jgi:hypothetical protein
MHENFFGDEHAASYNTMLRDAGNYSLLSCQKRGPVVVPGAVAEYQTVRIQNQ